MKEPQTVPALKALFSNPELGIFGAFFEVTVFDKVRSAKLGKKNRRGTTYNVVETELTLDGVHPLPVPRQHRRDAEDGEFTPSEGSDKTTTVVLAKNSRSTERRQKTRTPSSRRRARTSHA